jgi:nucleoside-diphosphate-sugar epimerase
VIHTSSAGTIGESKGEVGTADTAHRGSYLSHYERSKTLGEQAVLAEGERLGVEVVSLNPASVQGPGRTGGTARILVGYLTGRLRWAVDTVLSLVYVDDCTAAHLAAEERGVPGRRYLVSGVTLSIAEAAALLGEITGEERRIRYLPGWLASCAAALVGGGYRLMKKQAPFCPEMARVVRHGTRYDGSAAAAELGFDYTPAEAWLRTTVDWYREQGLA